MTWGVAHGLGHEVGGVIGVVEGRDEGGFLAGQGGPVQALKPRVQLDFACPSVSQAGAGVHRKQAVDEIHAVRGHIL